jgi:hypothetical protein
MDRAILGAERFFHFEYPGVELGHFFRLARPKREMP